MLAGAENCMKCIGALNYMKCIATSLSEKMTLMRR
jgi:hypothetical protein